MNPEDAIADAGLAPRGAARVRPELWLDAAGGGLKPHLAAPSPVAVLVPAPVQFRHLI